MGRKKPTDEEWQAIVGHYSGLPVAEQVALLWGESEAAAAAGPWKPGSGHEIQAYFDMDAWISTLDICVYVPRQRFRIFRPCAVISIDFIDPRNFLDSNFPHQEIKLRNMPGLPSREQAVSILGSGDQHPKIGECLVRLGWHRRDEDLELLEQASRSADRVVRYIALGAISWRMDEAALHRLREAVGDDDDRIRSFARSYCEGFGDAESRDTREYLDRVLP